MSLEALGALSALACAATWAFATIVFGRAAAAVDARVLNLAKCVVASVLLGGTSLLLGDVPQIQTRDLVALAVSAFLGVVVADTAYFVSLRELGAARGVLFVSLIPVCTALLAVPVLGEPLTARMLFGMAVTLGGITLVVLQRGEDRSAGGRLGLGAFWAVVYCVAQAGANVLTKGTDTSLSPLALSTTRMGLGTIFLFLWIVVVTRGRVPLEGVRPRAGAIAVGSFVGTYVGIFLGTFALRTVSAGVATTLVATTPLFALGLGLLWGERPTTRSAVGALVALGGVAVLVA